MMGTVIGVDGQGEGGPGEDEPAFRRVGPTTRPRILLAWSLGEDGKLAADDPGAELEAHGLDVRRIVRLDEVHQPEYDVLVTNDAPTLLTRDGNLRDQPERHLGVVSFAPAHRTNALDAWHSVDTAGSTRIYVRSACDDLSETFYVAADLPAPVERLVEDKLVPILKRATGPRWWFSTDWLSGRAWYSSSEPIQPFVRSHAGNALAGSYRRSDSSEGWVLPHDTLDKTRWILAALSTWAEAAGWPPIGRWQRAPRWQTVEERALTTEVAMLAAERAAVLRELDDRNANLAAALDAAERAATAGPRRLLEAKGDELVDAVATAFEALGFDVERCDDTAPPGDLGEDLRLRTDELDDGVVVVEVKGYDKGVRPSEVGKVVRHTMRAQADGVDVRATWWVVNHNRRDAPETRPLAMSNDDDTLLEYDADLGLVLIETHHLYEQVEAVRAGTVDATKVRADLLAASARWTPEQPSSERA